MNIQNVWEEVKLNLAKDIGDLLTLVMM